MGDNITYMLKHAPKYHNQWSTTQLHIEDLKWKTDGGDYGTVRLAIDPWQQETRYLKIKMNNWYGVSEICEQLYQFSRGKRYKESGGFFKEQLMQRAIIREEA